MPKSTKTILAIIILSTIGWLLNTHGQQDKTKANTFKIGVLLPLTGSGADQGEWIRRGLELAKAQSTKNTELLYEDTMGDPKKAIAAYENLKIRYPNIKVIITWGSGVGIALTPLVNKDKIIQMGVATAAPEYSTPDDFTFRNFPSSSVEAKFLSLTIKNKMGIDQIASIKIKNDYGEGTARVFKSEFEKLDGKVIFEESFDPNSTDFRTLLLKLKNLQPKYIFLAVYPKEGALLLKQAKEIGVTGQFISSIAILGSKELFSIAGSAAEGLVVVTSAPNFEKAQSQILKNFVDLYQKRYNERPDAPQIYSARAYDAFNIIAQLSEQCREADRDCFKSKLFEIKKFSGVSGDLTFDRNGDIDAEFNLQIVEGNKFVEFMSK